MNFQPQRALAEARRLNRKLEDAEAALDAQVAAEAEAERAYRQARAKAWLTPPEGHARKQEAIIDGDLADLRFTRDLAAGRRMAALESIRNARTQISLLQTMANSDRERAALDRTGPQLSA